MRITSAPYKISANIYFKAIISHWLGRWWWIIILPIAVQVIMATSNITFLYTAFMTLFLIYPPLVMFLYYNHALSPLSRDNTLLKEVAITDDSIELNFLQEDDDQRTKTISSTHITWEHVTGIEYTQQQFNFKLNGSNYQLLILPYSAITTDERQTLATYLSNKFSEQQS